MITRKIGAAGLALAALLLSGCAGAAQQVKDAIASAPAQTLVNTPVVPSLPNPNDLASQELGRQLEGQGFTPNADKTEYTRGAAVIVMQNGVPKTVRLKFDGQGVIECPPVVALAANYATGIDTLLGYGYSGLIAKHGTVCKAVPAPPTK